MANKLYWLVGCLFPMCVMAQTQPPNYLDEMAKVDAQIAFIQKQAELKTALFRSVNTEGMPRILSILIDSQGATAQLVYNSGIVRWVKRGDVLIDGLSVLAISKSAVTAGGQGGRFHLSFVAPQAAGAANAPPQGGLPPMPNVNIPMPLPPTLLPPAAAPGVVAPVPTASSAGKK